MRTNRKPRLRWFQFSLRTLFIATTIGAASIPMTTFGWKEWKEWKRQFARAKVMVKVREITESLQNQQRGIWIMKDSDCDCDRCEQIGERPKPVREASR